MFRFFIDRGGTFTDVYAEIPGEPGYRVIKLLSEDPENYPDAPLEGIRRVIEDVTGVSQPSERFDSSQVDSIRMGTTIATNALLERKGSPFALMITKGFGDLLKIGKQNRPDLFDLNIRKPTQLYETVVEVDERVRVLSPHEKPVNNSFQKGVSGDYIEILRAPNLDQIRKDLQIILDNGIRGLAVVLMHSSHWPDHEILIGSLAESMGFKQISISSQIMPRIKIVERGQTCCIDAYLSPHIRTYLEGFRSRFNNPNTKLLFMQSDGGLVFADRFSGSNAILSGPAGGVVGYAETTFDHKDDNLKSIMPMPVIGFDMGGTSTDVSRFDGEYDWVHETEIAGVHIQASQMNIKTVAAGGGSRLFYKNGMFMVGPESSGAHPGPVCYRKNGFLSLTDANLVLGRIQPEYFPKIFGKSHDLPLDLNGAREGFAKLVDEINADLQSKAKPEMTIEDVAYGFVSVANEVMSRPIREITVARGHDIRKHKLACFGGAGGQHACSIARALGISKIFIHRFAGILSAYGLGLADVVEEIQEPASGVLDKKSYDQFSKRLNGLAKRTCEVLAQQGVKVEDINVKRYMNLRYEGTDTNRMISEPADKNFIREFEYVYKREFGFQLSDRDIVVDDLRIRAIGKTEPLKEKPITRKPEKTQPIHITKCYFEQGWMDTPVFQLDLMGALEIITGPAILINDTSTIIVEPDCIANITEFGCVEIDVSSTKKIQVDREVDPIQISIFSSRFASIAEQMGRILQSAAVSTNIKERQDYSCAVFDPDGGLIANAPHQPVHLGSMGQAVRAQIKLCAESFREGDVLVSNHPSAGGTHLPDITVISPVFKNGKVIFYTASRGHHADIGGISPGSMPPFSTYIEEEGVCIKSMKIVENGVFKEKEITELFTNSSGVDKDRIGTRALKDNISDLKAQISANQKGIDLLLEMADEYTLEVVHAYMKHISKNAESAVRKMLQTFKFSRDDKETLCAIELMDDGTPIDLKLSITDDGSAIFDFTESGQQVIGNWNAPPAVTHSAVLYCLRCMLKEDIPLNQGCMAPIQIEIKDGSILSPAESVAVVAGNVLTSQRVVDVILKAFGASAASQGCMNNFTFGNETFGYYETIGGGAGAGPNWHGQSGVHTHMTNTRITDPEILEKRYPVLLRRFAIRKGSGGKGLFHGGDGLIREIEFLKPLTVAIISDRRNYAPYGCNGGSNGEKGQNIFIKKSGTKIDFGGKNITQAKKGDRIVILTPGGGGYGPDKK
ncbi:MAG: hydantoinase B/oxoprolinase family protein [Nitrospinales bacterium]